MIIKTETTIAFNPAVEFHAMEEFERDHPDWKKVDDSTVATYFVKTEVFGAELSNCDDCYFLDHFGPNDEVN